MQSRRLGPDGPSVSIVGFGAGALGDVRLEEKDAERLVGSALDQGITFFDSARSYGESEARLGKFLGPRRRDVVLATKGGYGAEGAADWTADAIRRGVEGALGRLATDVIDVFFLHSCDVGTLERGDVVLALEAMKAEGKIRLAGYSGDEAPLAWAIRSKRFDVVECSVSVFDQAAFIWSLDAAAERGIGLVAKRALGNAPWRFATPPEAWDVRTYWERGTAMGLFDGARDAAAWLDVATRFTVFAPGVASALVGTSRPEHLAAVCEAASRGPLPTEIAARFRDAWASHGGGWPGIV